MRISGAIAQLRTTDLAGSIRFYTTKVGLTASPSPAARRVDRPPAEGYH
jgi:hypothetical protein